MKFVVAAIFWDPRSLDLNVYKHPLLCFGDYFVVVAFDWCLASRLFIRGFKLFVYFSWGLLWAILKYLLQSLLTFPLLYQIWSGTCLGYQCNISSFFYLRLSVVMHYAMDLYFLLQQALPVCLPVLVFFNSSALIFVFRIVWCWFVLLIRAMYLFLLSEVRSQQDLFLPRLLSSPFCATVFDDTTLLSISLFLILFCSGQFCFLGLQDRMWSLALERTLLGTWSRSTITLTFTHMRGIWLSWLWFSILTAVNWLCLVFVKCSSIHDLIVGFLLNHTYLS